MAEKVQHSAKTAEVKRENSASKTRTMDYSHSMSSPVNQVMFLQRTIGNQAVQRMIKSGALQAKLKIGQPRDKYEQEADRVADAVMWMPDLGVQREVEPEEEEEKEIQAKPLAGQITPLIQRQIEPEEEEEEIRPKSIAGAAPEVTLEMGRDFQSIKGTGQPLSASERAFFEPRFGADFGDVRVHSDARAAHVARSVNARAFTFGRDVVFGAGQYAPGTQTGQRLLAHELAHVMQQTIQPTSESGSGRGSLSNNSSLSSVLQLTGPRRRRRRRRRYWRLVAGNIWKAVRPFATLQGLAYRVSKNRRNWMCIKPVKMKYSVNPYWQHISLGDEFDVSNLTKTTGPSLEGHELVGVPAQWAQRFYRVQAFAGPPDQEIAKKAKGNKPIASMLIIGHTNTTQMGRLNLSGLHPNKPNPTYVRACAGEFPNRCLFTRTARVRSVGCTSRAFGSRFARVYLRRGSRIMTTRRAVCPDILRNRRFIVKDPRTGQVVRIDPLPDQYRVCFASRSRSPCAPFCIGGRWYITLPSFHRGPFWAKIYGRL